MDGKDVLGRVEVVNFPRVDVLNVPARVDTGAKTSAIWATGIKLDEQGKLHYKLFGKGSVHYTGRDLIASSYEETVVSSSIGIIQKRYKVKLTISIGGKKIRAAFTLADRSKQVYPILIGRNILRAKFIVDVTKGKPLVEAEKARTKELRKLLRKKKV